FLPHVVVMVREQPWLQKVRIFHVVVFAFLWTLMIDTSWLLLAGIGREMPLRVVNGIYFYFLLGWFIGLHLLVAALRIKSLPTWMSHGRWTSLALPVVLCLSLLMPGPGFLRSPNHFLQAIHDLSGPLWSYRQQQLQRLEVIREAVASGQTQVVVPPFKDKPRTVFYEDIILNRCSNWRNRFMGALYGLKTVCLAEPAP
ncbi:MAG: hypothetical protein HQL73_13225, partial [Magnetococcales bacterium]|nr:hypothetical protein [Magnetococcales bacterium]